MDFPEVLIGLTEIAVALAGFTGVVVVFGSRSAGSWLPGDRLRMGFMFSTLYFIASNGCGVSTGFTIRISISMLQRLFEIVLNLTALFNHSNIRIPLPLDRALRRVLVTPDMHRVHHSADPLETDSNLGFNLPWWDYFFLTYRSQPAKGQAEMIVGLQEFRAEEELKLPDLLLLPFKKT